MDLLKINLQLFSEDDDLENGDLYDDSIDDDLDEEFEDDSEDGEANLDGESEDADEDGYSDSDSEKDDAKPKTKDKVTQALIKQKQINKMLKAKLDLIEQKDNVALTESKKKSLIDKLIDKGYDEDEALVEAEKQLENETIKNTVKKLEFMTENTEILSKYPQAKKNIDKLMKLQKSTGWSLEKICRVEYLTTDNAFDSKIKSDQEKRLKNKKKPSLTPAGGQTPIQSFKLDSDDERAYQFYAKKNPGVSKKQYMSNIMQASKQKIPHDSWD